MKTDLRLNLESSMQEELAAKVQKVVSKATQD